MNRIKMHVSKCCCFDLRTGCIIIFALNLLGSMFSVLCSVICDPISIYAIPIYAFGLVAIFKEQAQWLIPSIVWAIISPILNILYWNLSGRIEMERYRYELSTVQINASLFIGFVINLLFALVMWDYYKLLSEEKPKTQQQPQISTLNQLQTQTQNPPAEGDAVV